jgi:energy-coupling factor transport system substrate-specific component
MNTGLFTMGMAGAALAYAFYRFEKSRLSSKEIALIAALAAIAALGRIPFGALPSLQPTTFIVIVSGYVFGPAPGFFVGAAAAFVSNIFLGHGPWTVWQMLAWGICGGSAGVLGIVRPATSRGSMLVFAALWGYLFGWIMNLWYWISFVYPLSFSSWLAVNSVSFPFDTLHAAGNVGFVLVLWNGFVKTLCFFKKRLEVSSIEYYNEARQE